MNILNNWITLELITRERERLVCIEGSVHGTNPRFPAASRIRTSPVTGHYFEAGSMVIMTRRGSEYILGKPDASETFAQQRLMRRLSRLGQNPPSSFNALQTQVISDYTESPEIRKSDTAELS